MLALVLIKIASIDNYVLTTAEQVDKPTLAFPAVTQLIL